MQIVRDQIQRTSNKTTKLLAITCGEHFNFRCVCEYPRSGGTWLCGMVRDALQLSFPQNPLLPLSFPCVVHNHWRYNPHLPRPVYLYRDGRDIIVSLFFYRMKSLQEGNPTHLRRFKARYDRLFGRDYDPNDSRKLLPLFIENEFRHPRDARLNWRQHIDNWHDPERRPHILYLSYEELLADAMASLQRVAQHLADAPVDPWFIENAVERNTMARQTGRLPGQEDRLSFVRKGVVGDWRNHFTRETAEIFDELAGAQLVRLGYAKDRDWPKRFSSSAR